MAPHVNFDVAMALSGVIFSEMNNFSSELVYKQGSDYLTIMLAYRSI
jgi:hypothetical protein